MCSHTTTAPARTQVLKTPSVCNSLLLVPFWTAAGVILRGMEGAASERSDPRRTSRPPVVTGTDSRISCLVRIDPVLAIWMVGLHLLWPWLDRKLVRVFIAVAFSDPFFPRLPRGRTRNARYICRPAPGPGLYFTPDAGHSSERERS